MELWKGIPQKLSDFSLLSLWRCTQSRCICRRISHENKVKKRVQRSFNNLSVDYSMQNSFHFLLSLFISRKGSI
jgi:hypothetical protein